MCEHIFPREASAEQIRKLKMEKQGCDFLISLIPENNGEELPDPEIRGAADQPRPLHPQEGGLCAYLVTLSWEACSGAWLLQGPWGPQREVLGVAVCSPIWDGRAQASAKGLSPSLPCDTSPAGVGATGGHLKGGRTEQRRLEVCGLRLGCGQGPGGVSLWGQTSLHSSSLRLPWKTALTSSSLQHPVRTKH